MTHLCALSDRQQGGFVDHVGQLSPGETLGDRRQHPPNVFLVQRRRQGRQPHVHPQDVEAAQLVRERDLDLARKPARPRQRGVQHLPGGGKG